MWCPLHRGKIFRDLFGCIKASSISASKEASFVLWGRKRASSLDSESGCCLDMAVELGGLQSKETSSGFSNFRAPGERCKVGTGQASNASRSGQGPSAYPRLYSRTGHEFASMLMV